MSLKMLKWSLRALTVLTVVLLFTNAAAIGIGLMAVDLIVGGLYLMHKSACDRRQMHHLSLMHRL
ncbi:hypothetical protein [Lacticaseibacillus salsurivasis]|uniref:hypothetical protein n=1 Tax=Lacticaseibacillus salsurivasis TaxID=3081441 RepID=UPI0030C6AA78